MKESAIRPNQNITQLLLKWGSGDKAALDQLIPLVYDELRKLAATCLRRRSGSNTLQATALVHEAYVRLADQSSISMEHRAQFFGLAAKIMRDILVDNARKRVSAKDYRIRLTLNSPESGRLYLLNEGPPAEGEETPRSTCCFRPRRLTTARCW
jgi:RNA polymerase sigma factor (TIGR02999 family)